MEEIERFNPQHEITNVAGHLFYFLILLLLV